MERGKFKGFANSICDSNAAAGATVTDGGSKKAIEIINERSESWQQDMAQAIMPDMSCPQSM
jgi:hypothetical protein